MKSISPSLKASSTGLKIGNRKRWASKGQRTDPVAPLFCLGSMPDQQQVVYRGCYRKVLRDEEHPCTGPADDELGKMTGHRSAVVGDEYAPLAGGQGQHL
jgi:hypothetical protein